MKREREREREGERERERGRERERDYKDLYIVHMYIVRYSTYPVVCKSYNNNSF